MLYKKCVLRSLMYSILFLNRFKRIEPFVYLNVDALVAMEKAMKRDNIEVNDRQLACAHINSVEGQNYLKSMAAAGNFAWVNRSSMTFLSRQVRLILFSCKYNQYFCLMICIMFN